MSTLTVLRGTLVVMTLLGTGAISLPAGWAEERTIEEWIAALKDTDWKVRQQAAEALGQLRDGYALEPLTAALQDEVSAVRATAVAALGALGDQYSVEPVIGTLGDSDAAVRQASGKALTKITGENFGEDRERWQKWWEENQDLGGGY